MLPWQWSISIDRESLLITLRETAKRAAQLKQDVLASFTQPIRSYDTINVFTGSRLAGLGECFFWELPAEHKALIGIGAAVTIETNGITRFTEAASAWHALLRNAVVIYAPGAVSMPGSGPVLFGGFAFDPLCPRTQLWRDFPDGLLILPRLLFSYRANHVTLTINKVIRESDDVEQCANEDTVDVMHLLKAAEQASLHLEEDTPSIYCHLSIQNLRSELEWLELVADIVNMIQHGLYEKVVLARGVLVTPDAPKTFDVSTTLYRLRQNYPGAYIFAIQRGDRFFVGATPERLVQVEYGRIRTIALAGSAPRGVTEEEDVQIGLALLRNRKNNVEHAIVVATALESLMSYCTKVDVAHTPRLRKLKNVQHLETPIVGKLVPGRSILDVMTDLHPTPAVGGLPRQAALEAIRSREKLDRGWYAGPLGWIDASDDGEFVVALRSGLIDGSRAVLFAGCGIVADSDPQSEYAESCLKLQAMLQSLGDKE